MKNTLIINKLENFMNNDTISNQRQHYPDMYQPITELINALKTEVYAEEKNNKSYINRQKKAVSFLKKAGKNTYRPILKYSEMQEINGKTYQVFTDSYVVIALTEPLNLPDVSETDYHLPNIERLFNGCNFEKAEVAEDAISDILARLKAGMIEKTEAQGKERNIVSFETSLCNYNIDADRLKFVTEMLGSNELEVYSAGSAVKPIKFVNAETGDMALLLPFRRY